MALQDLGAPQRYPAQVGFSHLGLTLDQITLNATGYYVGAVVQSPKTGNIVSVSVRTGSAITTIGQMRVRLVTVDTATGLPTDTLYHANASGTTDINTANALATVTFASPVPTTRGDLFAVLFEWVSGDWTIVTPDQAFQETLDFPYPVTRLAGGTVAKDSYFMPNFGLTYDDGLAPYIPGVWFISNRVNTSYNADIVPDELAVEFVALFTARISHLWAFLDSDNACEFRLYSAANAVLASSSRPGNGLRRRVFGAPIVVTIPPTEIQAGSIYRISVLATQTVPNIAVQQVQTPQKGATPLGAGWKSLTRTDFGAWTETADRQPLIGFYYDQIDSAGGGGGLLRHPGMQGGFDA